MDMRTTMLLIFGLVAAIQVTLIQGGHHHHHEHHGHHDHHDHHGHFQPYGFGYDVHDGWGNTQYRHEKGTGPWEVKGSYGYKDAHGIHRHVDYVADKHGFRAHVRTNEPGTAPKDPAAVKMDAHPHPNPPHHHHKHHHDHHPGHYHTKHHESSHGHHPNHYAASEVKNKYVKMPLSKVDWI